jgi:4-amino-4-deoxy-L-arabinose transferase-like glycosyltransferase
MRMPPWRTQSYALAAFLAFACLTRAPTFYASVLDWDESLYLLMASAWRNGHLPYTTIWDNKPPGIYAIFYVALAIFGHHIVAIRAATILAATLTAFAVFRIAFSLLAASPVRLTCACAAGLAYSIGALSNDGLAANTEMFMVCFTALSLVTALSPSGARRVGLVTGALFAGAILTKYVAIFEAPAILLALLWWQPRGTALVRLASAGIGGLIPLAAIMLLYAWHGELAIWWQDSVMANVARAGAQFSPGTLHYAADTQLDRWLPFYAAPLALFWRWRQDLRTRIFLFIWLAGGTLGVAAAKSFYDHYFQQILPVLCVITALIFANLASRTIFALFAIFIAIPAYAAGNAIWPVATRPDTPAQIAQDLRAVLQPGQKIYVFDDQPIIYFLLNQTAPTRYVLPSTLTTNFLSHVAGVDAPAELARILATRPDYIIINNFPAAQPPNKNQTVYDLMAMALAANYHLWRSYNAAKLYQINPQTSAISATASSAATGILFPSGGFGLAPPAARHCCSRQT